MMKTDERHSTSAGSTTDSVMEQKLVQFAEQLGYVIGTVQAKADGWLDREALRTQITSVRDAATDLLKHVTTKARAGHTRGRGTTAQKKKAAAPNPAHAPGKKHRKPAPSGPGMKKSDQTIAKLRVAQANRQRRGG